jgi:pantoate--beta-alanine ligase
MRNLPSDDKELASSTLTPPAGLAVVQQLEKIKSLATEWQKQGKRVALVPTMGNLHEGHFSLVKLARQHADVVVVSIFVNPLQFGKNEDFDRYPRTLEQDVLALTLIGADVVFAPNHEVLYPEKRLMAEHTSEMTSVVPPNALVQQLCGLHRPGHFTGVATIVLKLFLLTKANVAIFGQKDYQQVAVIKQMVADLNLDISILAAATARAEDGLALSSRNQYLSPEQRMLAPRIYQTLLSMADRLEDGFHDYATLIKQAKHVLKTMGIKTVEYLEILHPETLTASQVYDRQWVILIAVKLGNTRLIDNLLVTAPILESLMGDEIELGGDRNHDTMRFS